MYIVSFRFQVFKIYKNYDTTTGGWARCCKSDGLATICSRPEGNCICRHVRGRFKNHYVLFGFHFH
jgi:hypothetical protein